jgi:hypothetical protein
MRGAGYQKAEYGPNSTQGSLEATHPGVEERVSGGAHGSGGKAMEALLAAKGCAAGVSTILWIIAAIFVIAGIVTLVRGGVLGGIVLIVVGLIIGPGGFSLFC